MFRGAVNCRLTLGVLLLALAALAGCDGSEGITASGTLNRIHIAKVTLPDTRVGDNYSFFIEVSGGVGAKDWRLTAGVLPIGMNINAVGNPKTAIFGVPAEAGDFPFTLTVSDRRGETDSINLRLHVIATALRITTPSVMAADCNQPYAQFIRAVNGCGQGYAWSLLSGSLPPGLTLATAGTPQTLISGTCSVPGDYRFTVGVADAQNYSDHREFHMAVLEPLVITTTQIGQPGCAGAEYPGATMEAVGGTGPGTYLWSLVSPASTFPPGLVLHPDGSIGGTPTVDGPYLFAVRARDGHSIQANANISMTIMPAVVVTPAVLIEGTLNTPYSAQFAATGGDGSAFTFEIVGLVPTGMSMSSAGVFAGSPVTQGVSVFTVKATSGVASFGFVNATFTVAGVLQITTASLPDAAETLTYMAPVQVTGGSGPFSWEVSGNFPAEFQFVANGNPGSAVYGQPVVRGVYTFTMTVTDGMAREDSRQFSLTIDVAPGDIITYGGGGNYGDGHPGSDAIARAPGGIIFDANGNLYFSEASGHRVRRIDAVTGLASTVAGTSVAGYSGDNGPGGEAQLSSPRGVAVNAAGSILYIADTGNYRVRAVDLSSGIITTVAGTGVYGNGGDGGPAAAAQFRQPRDLAVDAGGSIYILDAADNRVRRVIAGDIEAYAGTGAFDHTGDGGPAVAATLAAPEGICLDAAGSLYIACAGSFTLRKVTSSGTITTIAGQAWIQDFAGEGVPANQARLVWPRDVAVDAAGNVFFTDYDLSFVDPVSGNPKPGPFVVRRISGATGFIDAYAGVPWVAGSSGDGGFALNALFRTPAQLAVDPANNLFVCDENSHRIRRIGAVNNAISTYVGTGSATYRGDNGAADEAMLRAPSAMVFDAQGNMYCCDRANHRVRRIDAATKIMTTIAGTGTQASTGDGGPATQASLNLPTSLALDSAGNLFIAEYGTSQPYSGHCIRRINMATGIIYRYAGAATAITQNGDNGDALLANISYPGSICFDSQDNLYIACPQHHTVRKVTPFGTVTTFAGQAYYLSYQWFDGNDGPAVNAHLHYPWCVSVDAQDNVYICDTGNSCVRKVSATTGYISHYAGLWTTGYPVNDSGPDGLGVSATALSAPTSLVFDSQGRAYITDGAAGVVRRASTQGIVMTIAGQAWAYQSTAFDHGDGAPATNARFTAMGALSGVSGLRAIAVRGFDVYVADANTTPSSDRIRRIVKP
ncbi:MAG: hypothetical protein IT462_15460 [Planctomycetes bacterium]|nr:hypothetical protein [Planctomycetota bacterium]